jgi:hypothetical protein
MPVHLQRDQAPRYRRAGNAASSAVVVVLMLLVACSTTAVSSSPSQALPVVTTDEDFLEAVSRCLRAAGWKAEVGDDGDSMSVDVSGEQREAFIKAQSECEAQVGKPAPPAALGESEIRDRYAFLIEARKCLLDLGYAISEPPSVDTFIESWATGPWSPYLEVADMTTQQEWQEANDKCPQTPQ